LFNQAQLTSSCTWSRKTSERRLETQEMGDAMLCIIRVAVPLSYVCVAVTVILQMRQPLCARYDRVYQG
jgi:hypothetical protein